MFGQVLCQVAIILSYNSHLEYETDLYVICHQEYKIERLNGTCIFI